MKKLVLVEWDGDRSSPAGGFRIVLRTKKRSTVKYEGLSYDSGKERDIALAKARAEMETLKKKLSVEVVEEKIF